MASELQDLIVDDRPNPEILISGVRDSELRSEILREAMAGLTPREYTIIQKRRLVDDGATLESLGNFWGEQGACQAVGKQSVNKTEG